MNLMAAELNERQFQRVAEIIYELCGIHLKSGKEALVRARLMKRLRVLKMSGFEEYLKFIESDAGKHELGCMVDVMTTNKTGFFREIEHFNYLGDMILPELNARKLRFWTAACSSGEEPFSLSILLREKIPDIDYKDVKILATDISTRMLHKARSAVFTRDSLKDVPPAAIQKYFLKVSNETNGLWQVKDSVRSIVRLAWLNLMGPWPMKGPFNVIFCRNVMIYFDRVTQQRLVNRLWELIEPGGFLFVGHSEGLSAISHKFHYVKPAVYRK